MSTLFGLALPQPYLYVFALVTILVLLALFGWMLRRFVGDSRRLEGGSRGRQPRLGLVDTFSIDRQRQLVIIRRDTVEHLLLIGGNSDLVVETNIVRGAPNTQRETGTVGKPNPAAPPIVTSSYETASGPTPPTMTSVKATAADLAPTPMGSVYMPSATPPLTATPEGATAPQIDRVTPRASDLSEIARRFDRLTPTMRTEPQPQLAPEPTHQTRGTMPPVSMTSLDRDYGAGPADLSVETDVPETIIDPLSAPIIPLRDPQSPTDGLRRLLGRHQD